ncbi:caspase family protein [Denitratisoma oestradiolicum]|uniref:two-partner secretion domain-containing protein n=1 Tax=Denitratisoma oestradiolicum TaxID=311182 RepID=UPI001476DEA2|nr:caspase family protein [Denitratisoma oestradiolicum]
MSSYPSSPRYLAAVLALALAPLPVLANPTLPTVISGQASFQNGGNTLSVRTVTPATIINWQGFSINAGEVTRFDQPSAASAVLNRVMGQNPSQILGALQSNGRVFVLNPAGVVIGKDAQINVAGLMVSALPLADADFLAGRWNFSGPGGAVGNDGSINVMEGGAVLLIGDSVTNSGLIQAPNGQVVLAAGHSVTLAELGTPNLSVTISAATQQVLNLGQIFSHGGSSRLYGALVRVEGLVNANTVDTAADGTVILSAIRQVELAPGGRIEGRKVGLQGETINLRSGLLGSEGVKAQATMNLVVDGGRIEGPKVELNSPNLKYAGPGPFPNAGVQPVNNVVNGVVQATLPPPPINPMPAGMLPGQNTLPMMPPPGGLPVQQPGGLSITGMPPPPSGMTIGGMPGPNMGGTLSGLPQQPGGTQIGMPRPPGSGGPMPGQMPSGGGADIQQTRPDSMNLVRLDSTGGQPPLISGANPAPAPQPGVATNPSPVVQPAQPGQPLPIPLTEQNPVPGQPVQPGSVAQQPVGQPGQQQPGPAQPNQANQPNQPNQPNRPNNQQNQPGKPGEAGQPGEPGKPDPSKPDPSKPDPSKPDPSKPDPSKLRPAGAANQGKGRPEGGPGFGRINIAALSPGMARALVAERHALKAEVLKSALSSLEINPQAADIPPCGAGGGEICMAAARTQAAMVTTPRNKPTESHLPRISRKIAVLVGNDNYRDKAIPVLESAGQDAEAVGKVLTERLGYEVRVLRDATKGDIVRALNQLTSEVGPNDSVTLYYAGHGYLSEKSQAGYWLPVDAEATRPDNWISNQDIAKYLASIPAKQVMLVSDSCFSGALTREQKVSTALTSRDPNTILDRRSVVVLTSGGEEPVSDEGKGGHSIFAWHFMKALEKITKWNPGAGLYENVKNEVSREFPQVPQYGASLSAGHQLGGDYLLERRRYR